MPAVLADHAIDELLLEGESVNAQIAGSITDASTEWPIDAAPAITLTVVDDDPRRPLLNSGILSQKSAIHLDGINWELAKVGKSGHTHTLTFEHAVVAELRRHDDPRKIGGGLTSRLEFVRTLVRDDAPWITVVGPYGVIPERSKVALSRGKPADPTATAVAPGTATPDTEDTWSTSGKILEEIGWRRFVRGVNELWCIPDSFTFLGDPELTLVEFGEGVDFIDFDFDQGKPVATVTAQVRMARWQVPTGSLVEVKGLGPADGKWIVSNVARSYFNPNGTVTLIQPLPTLPEPEQEPDAATAGGADTTQDGVGAGAGDGTASGTVEKIMSFAESKVGGPYVWGGTGPKGYDCSGLTMAAGAAGGSKLPHNSMAQRDTCKRAGTMLTIEQGINTRGALLFIDRGPGKVDHVALSDGKGGTIEAASRRTGIIHGKATGRGWTQAAKYPGVEY